MKIPNFENTAAVDNDNTFSDIWQQILSELVDEMQNNLSNEGIKVPMRTTVDVVKLNTAKSIGALLYDSDTNELKVNINGTFKVVQVI